MTLDSTANFNYKRHLKSTLNPASFSSIHKARKPSLKAFLSLHSFIIQTFFFFASLQIPSFQKAKMQFSVVAATLALALGVAAQPHGPPSHGPLAIHQAKTQCGGGHVACCIQKSDIHADGIASGLLTKGLLTDVLGSSDQACAKWDLIENLNLLGRISL